jgi:microcystin degradation protein MlrC
MQDVEQRGDALSLSLVHSFPWGDTRDFGTRALAICDGNLDAAHFLAGDLANRARVIAETTPASTIKLDAALTRALIGGDGPFVLADGPDNPGGGAAGDSTFVLAALLDLNIESACLGPVWDPQAVAIAFEAGAGARLAMRVGGKTGPLSGSPLDLDAEIVALREAGAQTFAGASFPIGRAALIRTRGIEVVLVSKRDQARGPDLFTQFGVDLARKQIIVVKSSQHFYDGFASIAKEIIYLDAPGSLQSDLTSYAYARITRPRWPIDRAAPPPEPVSLLPRPVRSNT